MRKSWAPFLIVIAAMLWGTTGTTQALAPSSAHPIAIGATRLAVGGLFLLFVVFITGKGNFANWPIKATIIASLSMALYQPLFFSAVMTTGVAVGTVVAIGSAPILSGLIEWIFIRVRPQRVWWVSTALSIIGCLLLFANQEAVYVDPLGILMALGAGLTFACYTLSSGKLVENHSSLSAVAVVFTLSAMMLSPLLFLFDMSWLTSVHGVVVALQLGVMATGIAYLLFAQGLRNVASSTAVTLALIEPLTAALLGVFVLNESLSLLSWVGVLLLMLGVGTLIWASRKREIAEPA
ncbi:EamA family transporter [Oceanobacillus sp. J11TS1]|uniref:EamA family transporter n=1 Tax=Oceanobacillus sp. J11TS1 TaxID=2807191 RepID=UPI001B104764|nr:EamA family transporter [Oceanobacillus sp. J11TS1]GIO22146.1 putative transporter YwfM [Oceanobacillus sp. J11TS1]